MLLGYGLTGGIGVKEKERKTKKRRKGGKSGFVISLLPPSRKHKWCFEDKSWRNRKSEEMVEKEWWRNQPLRICHLDETTNKAALVFGEVLSVVTITALLTGINLFPGLLIHNAWLMAHAYTISHHCVRVGGVAMGVGIVFNDKIARCRLRPANSLNGWHGREGWN